MHFKTLFITFVLISLCIMVHADYAIGNAPFINTWKILGPLPERVGFNYDMIGEKNIEPALGDETRGLKWEYIDDRLFSRNYDDYVDVYSFYKIKKNINPGGVVVYLHNYVYSPKEENVQIRYSGDRYSKVFLNGQYIIGSRVGFPNQRDKFDNLTGGFEPSNWFYLQDNATKDALIKDVTLKEGWNSILIKIGNERESVLGLYFRICDTNGNEIPSLTFSINGPKNEKLEIDNRTMTFKEDNISNNMPQGYAGWPYVGFHQSEYFKNYCKSFVRPEHYRSAASAEDFQFTASGGKLPYKFEIEGSLPKGLKFDNGKIYGTIAPYAELKDYNFTIKVTDKDNNTDSKSFCINVKERPNKWVEKGRMTALVHSPEKIPQKKYKELVSLMEQQGYCAVMPINFNNGLYNFRSKNRFNNVPEKDLGDVFTPLKKAFENSTIAFGTYNGNLPLAPQYSYDQVVCMYEDLMKNCTPSIIWHDWLGVCHGSVDAVYSLIKTINPDVVILQNGVERFTNGDWDIISIEFMTDYGENTGDIWDKFVNNFGIHEYPMVYHWPKEYSMETWHALSSEKAKDTYPDKLDWDSFLKLNISVISEGGISNLDHTISSDYQENQHKKMAKWANNKKSPEPLYKAYTNCYPMPSMADNWGYVNVSSDGKALYAIAIENPRGKTGLPEKELFINDFKYEAESVIHLNSGKECSYYVYNINKDDDGKGKGNLFVIDTSSISSDPVADIFKITLKHPAYNFDQPITPKFNFQKKKEGNLAYHKTARFLSADCQHVLFQSSGWNKHPTYAIDGDMKTETAPGGYYSWALWVDLEEEYDISKVCVYMSGVTTDYRLEISQDNETWKTIAEGQNNELSKQLTFNFDEQKARFVRFISLKPNGSNQPGGQMSISEFEVY